MTTANKKREESGTVQIKIQNKIEFNRTREPDIFALSIFCAIECLVIGLFERVNKRTIEKKFVKFMNYGYTYINHHANGLVISF